MCETISLNGKRQKKEHSKKAKLAKTIDWTSTSNFCNHHLAEICRTAANSLIIKKSKLDMVPCGFSYAVRCLCLSCWAL